MEDKFGSEIRRIFLKLIVLKIIGEKPIHGYDIMKEVERRSGGRWTPSPGSIYPALEDLQSRGWITFREDERRKLYSITPKGEAAKERLKLKWQEQLREMATFFETIIEESDTAG